MEDAQCDGAAFGGSGGLGTGTAIMSFADVLSCRQRPGPPVSVGGVHVLQNEHLTAAVMQTGVNSDGEVRAQSTPVQVVVRARRTPQCPPLRCTEVRRS